MKHIRKSVALRLLGMLCFAAVAGAAMNTAAAQAALEGKRLAYLTATTSNPFIAALAKTIQEQSEKRGMSATVLTSPYDAALQSQQVSDAIAQGYDALLITPISERAIVPALTAAKAAKVPVFVVNSPIADGHDELYESFIGEDHAVLGRLTGEALAQALKDRKNPSVALITGSLAEGVAPRRLEGFKKAIEAHPEIKIVATEDAKWDTATSERIAGQLFARFAAQGGLDAIYAMADNMAHGTILAAKAAGVPLGTQDKELVVVSSNCMKFGIDHIRAGEQYSTATQMPGRTGTEAVATAAAFLQGKPVEKHHYLEMAAITKENLDKFADACTF
ncbi:sugar ABC transporter substrate-binding protein [Pusillimonas noertemannii]|uniref:sugar ABC transporter substrate-binding protein n=1 Tax=Pusillimonas noertemannii TaxID=305977 RepID=UPI0012FD30A5|nr:sugar ABC transporter substrate-binding protein [Pusillimonas noertemannii]